MVLGEQRELSSEINVTPMIDVLLVLLVCFMLSVQLRNILRVNVPPPVESARPAVRSIQVVLELRGDGSYAINGATIPVADVEGRLRELTDGGRRQLLFVRAAPGRTYGEVLRAVDVAKGAGWRVVGYMP